MPEEAGVQLRRQLSVFHGIGIICGIVVGGGIFITPKAVLVGAGSVGLALILWVVCGVITTLGALCFAEIGTTIPVSGGDYSYILHMYGEFPAFMNLWSYINLSRPASNATKVIVFAEYVTQMLSSNGVLCSGLAKTLLSVCLCWLLCFVNIVRVRWAAHAQIIVLSLNIMVMFTIIILGVIHVCTGHTEYISPGEAFSGTITSGGDMTVAIMTGLFTYGGWSSLNYVSEELKDPARNLPRALVVSMIMVTLLYTGVNFAYFSVLGGDGVIKSTAVGLDFASRTLGVMFWVIPFAVAIATTGSLNSAILIGSRTAFVGGRTGHLPSILALINVKFLSPITAIIYQGVLTTVFSIFVDVYSLIQQIVFFNQIYDCLIIAGMLYYRYTKPDLPRPVKLPLIIPLLYLPVCVFLVVIPLIYNPRKVLAGLAILLTGIPYYVMLKLWMRGYKPTMIHRLYYKVLVIVQKTLYCCEEQESAPQ